MARLGDAQAQFAANLVNEAKHKVGFSNSAIADKATCNEKTVRDVLKGKCQVRETVKKVCRAVEIDLDEALEKAGLTDERSGTAPGRLGGYSKEIYGHLVGTYTTVRTAYSEADQIKCYRTTIEWDAGITALTFHETDRLDAHGQNGQIYIPSGSAFMYLMTINRGWIRAVLVSQLVDGVRIDSSSMMRGLILSQYNVSGANYAPIATPIVYVKEKSGQAVFPYGEIDQKKEGYERCRDLLQETVTRSYAKMLNPAGSNRQR